MIKKQNHGPQKKVLLIHQEWVSEYLKERIVKKLGNDTFIRMLSPDEEAIKQEFDMSLKAELVVFAPEISDEDASRIADSWKYKTTFLTLEINGTKIKAHSLISLQSKNQEFSETTF
jgi:hypothetical protein